MKVYTKENCPQCKDLKIHLDSRKVKYTELPAMEFDNFSYLKKKGVQSLPYVVIETSGEVSQLPDYFKNYGKY